MSALQQTEYEWLSATLRSGEGTVIGASGEHHLCLALRCSEHRRGAFWETAGFLALWLSGLAGVALCLL